MRADARRNHARLLRVATEAFAEHGEGASLDDIAKRAGVGSGTLYRHFPTRQVLLEAAYAARIDALGERGEELSRTLPPGEALTAWLHELCVATIQVRGLKSLMGSAVADADSTPLTACGTVVRTTAKRLVEQAQSEGALRPDLTPADLLRLTHGIATAAELGGGEKDTRRYLDLLLEGLRPLC
ncbi:TetR/AcrR family transcriptional regulator [Streptomyces bauhiniae]|uniref:TetR/AcrR family transcriptional regulator n=1 Tax=Streptomyces bauhiniae TaxID=2340725 RepID=UPI00365E0E50